MLPDYLPELFVTLSQRFGLLLAGGVAVLTLTPLGRISLTRKPSRRTWVAQTLLFGLFGVLGTYSGNVVFQSYANMRAMGVITAGLFGGPAMGLGAGLIAGGHRYLIDIAGFSALPCSLATVLEGLAAGLVARRLGNRRLHWGYAGGIALVGESVHMVLVASLSKPTTDALALVQIIAGPMILVNALGASLFVELLAMQIRFRDKRDSGQTHQILSIVNQTVGLLRRGLNPESARATAKIIYDLIPVAAVDITSKDRVLAHMGDGGDHHVPGSPIRTEATKKALEEGEGVFIRDREMIGCDVTTCPLTEAIIVPLRKSSRIVGCLKLYGTADKPLDHTRFELAKGLADIFSTQLELEDIQIKNQLLAHAEIRRLQAQINPHFLFNSLNTIASFCRTSPRQARELLLDLSHYMRQSLDSSRGFIPFAEELSRVRSYISIEKARFSDRIRYEEDIAPEAEAWLAPPLLVQPLVENGVRHGILGRESGGVVRLTVRVDDDVLRVCVEDDGVGMPPQVIAEMLAPSQESEHLEGGIGVRNCNSRLGQLFGPEHGLAIASTPGKGTRVELTIPSTPLSSPDAVLASVGRENAVS
ncbi:LytS/YhcK type 5TM receptor domain-containing protein [Oceanidesulfovibrio marinus]|uniref:histidine kinase n=1 Tax=Oceanidesulfovibrio marinus TaxID=370038 RepID=A0A6P1ZH57_9BACT|nr:LytS/YhcK type 5TM receptor domain-containing protein [Oceanidesulfovibrio marinus]TVM34491.1 transcriptional regulator [Oceanidesulfovibrio marinus]